MKIHKSYSDEDSHPYHHQSTTIMPRTRARRATEGRHHCIPACPGRPGPGDRWCPDSDWTAAHEYYALAYAGRTESTVLLGELETLDAEMLQEEEAEAKAEAEKDRPGSTMFTDGSRLDSCAAGYSVVWKRGQTWVGIKTHLGYSQEAYDAACVALARAVESASRRQATPERITIFTDAQAAIGLSEEPSPGQIIRILGPGSSTHDAAPQVPCTPQAKNLEEKVGGGTAIGGRRHGNRREAGPQEVVQDAEKPEAGRHGCWEHQEARLEVLPTEDRALPFRAVPQWTKDRPTTAQCWWCRCRTQTGDHLFKVCPE